LKPAKNAQIIKQITDDKEHTMVNQIKDKAGFDAVLKDAGGKLVRNPFSSAELQGARILEPLVAVWLDAPVDPWEGCTVS
jgi:hypothetical protein